MRYPILSLSILLLSLAPSLLWADDLLQIYQTAKEQDRQLEAARLGLLAQTEQRNQARAAVMPTVAASASIDYSDHSLQGDNLGQTGALVVQQPLYHKPVLKRMDQVEAEIIASELQYRQAQQALIQRVASAYFDVLAAQDSLTLSQQELKAIELQLNQTKQRFDVGMSPITDVYEAQARFDLASAQLLSSRAALDSSREALREIINRSMGELATLQQELPLILPEPVGVEPWIAQALEHNLELALQQAQIDILQTAIEQAEAGDAPSVDLTARLARSLNNHNADATTQSLGVQLNWPLYTGGLTDSMVAELRYQQQQAEANLVRLQRSTIRSVRSAWLGIETAIELVKARKQALSSAETALKATETGLHVGTRTLVDLLNSQKDRFSAQRDYTKARYDLILANLGLKQAAGVLQQEDLVQINRLLQ
ncbi:hypothetical protein D5085_06195 [Ectothiorhodospiraceae bacterium BW-2]|nr:hypothetical protein D5085_06195 [Ectothiorhodospiraceae bacterium BW-2]